MSESVEAFLPLSNLAFHILIALADGDQHGYGIIKDVEERTRGTVNIRSGALYSMLQKLREDGLVTEAPTPRATRDARRRYYRVTAFGRKVAAAESERLAEMLASARRRRLAPEKSR